MLKANKETGAIRIDGEIGSYFENGIGSAEFSEMLDSMDGKPLAITIKSDGGDVFEGLSIYNQLKSYPGEVSITVDALAASIASVIVMAADDLAIFEGSRLYVHNPWTIDVGEAEDFRNTADVLDMLGNDIAAIYARRTGLPKKDMLDLMAKPGTYLSAEESVQKGFASRVIEFGGKKPQESEPLKAVAAGAGFCNNKNNLRKLRLRTSA